MNALLKALALLVALAAIAGASIFFWIGTRGLTAKATPGRLETLVARTMRRLAIPRDAGNLKNPIALSPQIIDEGMAHYADHCASCHANDGSGETELGLGMYPKPPDMRLADTQALTDGELFYIIENGVRLTGMPAWSTGTGEGRESTWHLVHFIRALPRLTPEQIEKMKGLNPRSPEEIRQQIEEERFLAGGPEKPAPPTSPHEH